MAQNWTSPAAHTFWDAYLDWSQLMQLRREALLPRPKPVSDWWESIFVRLKPTGTPATIEAARVALSALVNDPASRLAMDPHEYGFLRDRMANPGAYPGMADEYALYRKFGTPDDDQSALWDLLDVGSMVNFDANSIVLGDAVFVEEPAEANAQQKKPIVAIIDDGIGFLNARFCKRTAKGLRTRFRSLWLQGVEETTQGQASAPRRVYLGEVLSRKEINVWLKAGDALDEGAVYSALNAQICRTDERRSTDFSQTHGTHVLDLAAGADPDDKDDPAGDWPLLGVQLPATAIEDTSGTKFENYMVQGVRWILRQAARIDDTAPVIINLSMGILAGPKNGTRFTEYQIAREAKTWEDVTGQPVRIVWSFGNAYHGNLVATYDYPAEEGRQTTDRTLEWRIQPEDETASYVEIHTDPGTPSTDLEIALTTPDGVSSGFTRMAPGEVRSLERNGKAIARLYHVPEHVLEQGVVQRSHHVVAVAQSGNKLAGEALADAGGWHVGVRYKKDDAAQVHLQVQRDESLAGYRPGARQSYFDGPGAHVWDPLLQDWNGLSSKGPITHDGTLSALATAKARQVFTVGAVQRDRSQDELPPSLYTAEGGAWTISGPTGSTVADDGRTFWGVLAAGTFTGSVRALDGTSVAAGRMTRALAMCAPTIIANAHAGGGSQLDDLDPDVLPLRSVDPLNWSRSGTVIVNLKEGARPRF